MLFRIKYGLRILMVIAGNFSLLKMKVVLAMSNQRSVVQQINEQKDFLLECVNSLLEWEMFSGINPVRNMYLLSWEESLI